MFNYDYIIRDRPKHEKLHILECMIFGFEQAFLDKQMPLNATEMHDLMVHRYYLVKDDRIKSR